MPEAGNDTVWIDVAVRAAQDGDFVSLGAPQAVAKANSSCPGAWALDGNTGVPAGSFLGLADPASQNALELRARNATVAEFTPRGNAGDYGDAPSVALGSTINFASFPGATVGGGGSTRSGGNACVNCANLATAIFATVAGGQANIAGDPYAAVGGGQENEAQEDASTVAGGYFNRTFGAYSSITGGLFNVARGVGATVAGGGVNCAGGNASWVGGTRAITRPASFASDSACNVVSATNDADGDEGAFVWADAGGGSFFSSTGPNQFAVRAQGGVGINVAPPDAGVELTVQSDLDGIDYANLWLRQKSANGNGVLISVGDGTGSNNAGFYIDHFNGGSQARRFELAPNGAVTIRSNVTQGASGVSMAPGAGAWSSLSDRRLKTDVAAVDPARVLEGLLATPIASWSYRSQPGVRHLGPMAQDFAAAFGLGENDTTISTVDADGVAMAALQGLNAKLERENADLRAAHDALARKFEALDRRVRRLERD